MDQPSRWSLLHRVHRAVAALCALLLAPWPAAAQRRTLDFDRGWRFHLGDVSGAQAATFDDAGWRTLDVPHDWSIEGEFSDTNRRELPAAHCRAAWAGTARPLLSRSGMRAGG